MAGIFINYRRADTGAEVDWLYEKLSARYGADYVFRDVANISLGADFETDIEQAIQRADWFLPAIGPRWLDSRNDSRPARLFEPDDLVRREMEEAFASNVGVIPLLFAGAKMPKPAALPHSIAGLPRLNGHSLAAGDDTALNHILDALDTKCAALARGELVIRLAEYFGYSWDVLRTENHPNHLRFALSHTRLEKDLYLIIMAGVLDALMKAHGAPKGLREILLLNRWERQGWVFEVPDSLDECRALLGQGSSLAILGRSHTFMTTSDAYRKS